MDYVHFCQNSVVKTWIKHEWIFNKTKSMELIYILLQRHAQIKKLNWLNFDFKLTSYTCISRAVHSWGYTTMESWRDISPYLCQHSDARQLWKLCWNIFLYWLHSNHGIKHWQSAGQKHGVWNDVSVSYGKQASTHSLKRSRLGFKCVLTSWEQIGTISLYELTAFVPV